MTRYTSSACHMSGCCMHSAVASTSARAHKILDTALGVVSILIILLFVLLKFC